MTETIAYLMVSLFVVLLVPIAVYGSLIKQKKMKSRNTRLAWLILYVTVFGVQAWALKQDRPSHAIILVTCLITAMLVELFFARLRRMDDLSFIAAMGVLLLW